VLSDTFSWDALENVSFLKLYFLKDNIFYLCAKVLSFYFSVKITIVPNILCLKFNLNKDYSHVQYINWKMLKQ
jgi:hypothetical protein